MSYKDTYYAIEALDLHKLQWHLFIKWIAHQNLLNEWMDKTNATSACLKAEGNPYWSIEKDPEHDIALESFSAPEFISESFESTPDWKLIDNHYRDWWLTVKTYISNDFNPSVHVVPEEQKKLF